MPDEDTDIVVRALASLPAPDPMTLRLAGAGRFRSAVWAGLHGDLETLRAFREAVREVLVGAGFPIDERPFQPHLTIAYRFDRRTAAALNGYAGPSWTVDGFALVESRDGDYHRIWQRPTGRR